MKFNVKELIGDGLPIPWFTYPAIEFIHQLDISNKSVFEWGSGSSSKYFANNCKSVISIETDPTWVGNTHNNLQVILLPNDDNYPLYIKTFNQQFDIIVVDGESRYKCCTESINHLQDTGMIILDNSNWFVSASDFLREHGLTQIDFHGYGPINEYPWTTSIFLNKAYDFKPKYGYQPHEPFNGNIVLDIQTNNIKP